MANTLRCVTSWTSLTKRCRTKDHVVFNSVELSKAAILKIKVVKTGVLLLPFKSYRLLNPHNYYNRSYGALNIIHIHN